MVKAMVFPAVMYCCESWTVKKAECQSIDAESPESLLDSKEIKPVHLKGDQPWIFTGKTDAEADAPIIWPPDAKDWLNGKDPDAGKDWRQKEKTAKREWDG